MDEVTQLVEAIRTHVHRHPNPNLYLTEDDVWDMALGVLGHTGIPYKEDPNDLVYSALLEVWDEIPGVEVRGTWEECFEQDGD